MSHEYGDHLSNQAEQVRGTVARFAVARLLNPGKRVTAQLLDQETRRIESLKPRPVGESPAATDSDAGLTETPDIPVPEEWTSDFHPLGDSDAA
jgi:hypothetical protein